ncbi:Chromatin modification-related protein eaf3 [Colletotrichum tanaceti]|uniref:Chromatin modification-related protein EAF3 n=1 Tax=Colletotrichum tanaceti TaxID=1306861 RepID=A0A4U6XQR5_9PEZI|nr:Chromatin modification-related protein eaf3 [Colletotrichum tanaceti]TKW58009.1 Chromatin modification-related protein eaf3 [Colletotrichum tanaceti]
MAPTRPPAQPFSKDEKVLCFHGEMLYEAKILDVQPADSGEGFQYRIHYKGWKNTWDDWVSIDRIRKFTEENKELASTLHTQMKDLRQKSSAKAPKKGLRVNGPDSARGSEERTAAVAASGRGPRRARDFDLEQPAAPIPQYPPFSYYTLPEFRFSSLRSVAYDQTMPRFDSPDYKREAEQLKFNYGPFDGYRAALLASRSGMIPEHYIHHSSISAAPGYEQRSQHAQQDSFGAHESYDGPPSYYLNDDGDNHHDDEGAEHDDFDDKEWAEHVYGDAGPCGLVDNSDGPHDHEADYTSDFENEEYVGVTEHLDDDQHPREHYYGDNEDWAGHQDNEESEEPSDDIDWAALVHPSLYGNSLSSSDSDTSAGSRLSLEEIERRQNTFLPQWNQVNWQAPSRNPPSTSISPRASNQPSRNRAHSVISISSDESESSIELLGVSRVKFSKDASRCKDARQEQESEERAKAQVSLEQQSALLLYPQDRESAGGSRGLAHMPIAVDLTKEHGRENVVRESNKRKRASSIEFLFAFRRNVRPRQH